MKPATVAKNILVGLLGLAGWLGAFSPVRADAPKKLNILWISCEDMSPDLGCYGSTYSRSPNIDKLARQGLRFTRAFMVAGVCAPSRSAIITGMYPTSIGTHHMRSKGVPPPYVRCFTEYLRALGYYCTNNVKTDYNFDSPITAWDENSAKAHWRNRRKDQPFFAVFNITTTHESQIRLADKEFLARIAKVKPEDRHDPAKAELPPYYPDTPMVRQDWARYHDLITAMDIQVGQLLHQLEEDGLLENTIVFFWSDHGRGLPRAKRWIYDSGIHVPLIVRWPGRLEPDKTREDLVSSLDFAPTLISLAGGEVPKHLQGPVFLGDKADKPRQYIFAVRDRMDEKYDRIRCVREERYHYLRNFEPKIPYAQNIAYMDEMPTMKEWRRLHALGQLKGPQALFFQPDKPEEELYDTLMDPHEINNLASSPEHQETLKKLRQVLLDWQKETKDLGHIPEEKLKEMMRPGGKWSVTNAPAFNLKEGAYPGPIKIQITCPTPGASIAYTTSPAANSPWLLYTGEISLTADTILRTKACRLGYKDSPEVQATYKVQGGK
jgi:N-sulfoglucosamine sulfohydrolase